MFIDVELPCETANLSHIQLFVSINNLPQKKSAISISNDIVLVK